jgi:hypothetical protein
MRRRCLGLAIGCLVAWLAVAAPPNAPRRFEDLVRLSDRIVLGTVQGAGDGSVRLPDGTEIPLGIHDPASRAVFTPHRVRITECLFDKDDSCAAGDSEVLTPGGTVYELVEGERRLRTWEVAGPAGAPLPPAGKDVLLFLTNRHGRLMALNEPGSRVLVDHSTGAPMVTLNFKSTRLLSPSARDSARGRIESTNAGSAPPSFTESVPVDRLRQLVLSAREVLKPTSGIRHATPTCAAANGDGALEQLSDRLRAGQDPQRRESPLDLGNHPDSTHGPGDGRRSCGP